MDATTHLPGGDMAAHLESRQHTDLLRFIVCGSVDDGTSTLIDRLLHESTAVFDDIATGVAYRFFATDKRRFAVADAPGHEQYTRDMVTGASTADLAIILVDARNGVVAQTRRDSYLASLLGVPRIVLAVDKMDLVDYRADVFSAIEAAYRGFGQQIGLRDIQPIPISAVHADNILAPGGNTTWYDGPSLMEHLESVPVEGAPASAPLRMPVESADQFEAALVWMGDDAMMPGRTYLMKIGTKLAGATVARFKYKLDLETLNHIAGTKLERDEIGICELALDQPVAFESYVRNRELGGFILVDRISNEAVAAGMLRFALRRSQNVHWQALDIDRNARAAIKGQKPCVLWFTGIPASGKSTIANRLEKRLHAMGRHTYLLDGDNVRHGLNRDLGFTQEARVENIRRVAEVARLMADAGLIVLVAFISPFRSERRMARSLLPSGEFLEVFVDAPIAVAEARDPKGLYAKARRGELANFTGVDSPYEAPENADVRIDTGTVSPETAVERIIEEMRRRGL